MITPAILYFIKANLAIVILYFIYRSMFREDTFLRLRRITLLSIFLFAFLYQIPDLSQWISSKENLKEMVSYYSSLFLPEIVKTSAPPIATTDWKTILIFCAEAIYFSGVIFLLTRSFIEIMLVAYKYLTNKKVVINGIKVAVLKDHNESFSFFGWIFMSQNHINDNRANEILLHEHTHSKQGHSFDIMFGEAVCILCWINPFAWLIKKEIGINHEYLADQKVLNNGCDKKEYQYLLIGMKSPHNGYITQLYNHFSVLLLKNRITMLNKKRTKSIGKAKYLTLIPVAAAFLVANNIDVMARITNLSPSESVVQTLNISNEETKERSTISAPQQEDPVYSVVEQAPEYPGGVSALLSFLAKNIKYPANAVKNKIQGRVQCSFIVNKDGSLSDVKVVKAVDPELDAEAVRVIQSMPKWTPGKEKGVPVRVTYTVPITFRLQ